VRLFEWFVLKSFKTSLALIKVDATLTQGACGRPSGPYRPRPKKPAGGRG
jgi:hypothetical protein